MAQRRKLAHPPIQEATIQFEFGGSELAKAELETFASVYVKEGWKRQEAHALQATIAGVNTNSPSVSTVGNFLGFVLISSNDVDLVQVRSSLVAGSKRQYSSWEDLTALAKQAFEHYVAVARPERVTKISTRFINRLPPKPQFRSFDDILIRPPLPIQGLEDAVVSDFLRRHVLQSLKGGFVANLTIGTVVKEPGEEIPEPALVIDSDVFKPCDIPPSFDALESELVDLRSIKNALFFGSLKEAVVEEFV